MRRYRWQGWRSGDCSFLGGLLLCIPLLLIEPALLPRHPVPPPLAPMPDGVAMLLLLLLPVHGWMLERILASRNEPAAPPAAPARWLRGCRFFLASVPVCGLFVLPWWRRLEEARPSWAFRGAPGRRPLDLRPPAGRERRAGAAGEAAAGPPVRRRQRPAGWPAAAGLMAISVALPLAWAVWLGGSVARGSGYRIAAATTCGALHLAIAACAMHDLRRRRRRARHGWRDWAWLWLPSLGLVPLAGVGAILLGLLSLDRRAGGEGTLASTVHDRRWTAGRLSLWFGLEEALRRRWQARPWWRRALRPSGLEHPAAAGRAEKGLLAFHRYKGLATFFDGVAVAWLLALLAERHPARAPWVVSILHGAWSVSLVLAGAGLAERGVLLAGRLLRAMDLVERLDRHPYGRALLVPYSALAAGVLSGQLLAAGRERELVIFLSLAAALGTTAGALALMLQSILPAGRTVRVEAGDVLPAPLLLLALLAGELALALGGGAHRVTLGLEVAAASSPLGSALCGLAWGRWLLRPFGFRDLLASGLGPGRRWLLAALAASAVLPLGGLAAPLWVLARQRAWPWTVEGSRAWQV